MFRENTDFNAKTRRPQNFVNSFLVGAIFHISFVVIYMFF